MDNNLKQQIMDAIEAKSEVFIKSGNEYRIRCPICGDSQKNPRDAHCYIKCSYDPNEPLLYICFKCNSRGIVNKAFLERLNINKKLISQISTQRYNRILPVKSADVNIITGSPILGSPQTDYIERRLGPGFTAVDYDRFKIIWDMQSVVPFISSTRVRNTLPSNRDSISFLSDDKSSLLTRNFEDDIRWRKVSMFQSEVKSFYLIKMTLDLFTEDPVVVNVAEGVMDVLSIYRNFNDGPNSVFIAALGSDYFSAIDHIVGKGIIGSNVILKVYIDGDVDERMVKVRLKSYKWLFNQIYVYRNIISKDVGTTVDQIRLVESKI